MSAESIFKRSLTETQKATLERIKTRQETGDDSRIDYSEIPELTEEQWTNAIRPNRAREYVGVRLDWDVLAWLKEYGPGHSTRINQILRAVMEQQKAAKR